MNSLENCSKCSNRLYRFCCNQIFYCENRLRIRYDFIQIYSTIVQRSPQRIKGAYKSASHFYYYTKISEYDQYIKKYDSQKKSTKSQNFKGKIETSSNIFGLVDSVFTLLILPGLAVVSISLFIIGIQMISVISSILTLALTFFNLASYFMVLNKELLKLTMENLFVNIDDLPDLELPKNRNTLVGVYIWDFSICSTPVETIKGFLLLLMAKSISVGMYNRILSGLTNIIPVYFSNHELKIGTGQMLHFLWNQRKNY